MVGVIAFCSLDAATFRGTGALVPQGKSARPIAYAPREGDLIFYDDQSRIWTTLFALAGTGPPLHMGMIVKRGNGKLAVLEAGPDDTLKVEVLDFPHRLHQFHRDYQGTITIRRCKASLTGEQSAALTKFAEAQQGKRYAFFWLLLQGTPFRVRGPLEPVLARTRFDQNAWICSEISIAAGTVAGLFDPKVVAANVAYPRDLQDNTRYDLSGHWHDGAVWRADASARKR
jgi:hypothetical protein